MSRQIDCASITAAVAELALRANRQLPADVVQAMQDGQACESAPLARQTMADLIANQAVAQELQLPLCQDTGTAVVFVELGQEVQISGGLLNEAIQLGVAQGYEQGYLRKSIVGSLSRENTGNNTPAIVHLELVAGDGLKITLAPKGGGAENMSRLAMLKPAAGLSGIKEFVLETVRLAGPNPCPPLVVGVGVGGNFEAVALLAKQALLRPLTSQAADPQAAQLEQELLTEINALGIGPQGFGGVTTALAVLVESAPCHFASLPVAVNLNCHVARHASVSL